MIKTELFTIRGRELRRTYSDANRYVVRDGVSYTEAVDPAELGRVYIEGETMPPAHIPAWDISQAEYFNVGDLVTRDNVTYRCTSGHYAAWAKQPPNESYWEVADNDSIT